MNFELIDNLFQVTALGCAAAAAMLLSLRKRSRSLLMLALAYACFSMGTLYFVLHLAITGDVPQVFYVSEVSWLASYLSFLSLQILRSEALRIRMRPLPAAGAALTAALALVFRMLGPSLVMSLLFALTLGAIVYLSAFHLQSRPAHRRTDGLLLVCIALQLLLFIVSTFFEDYTRFNLYFAVDIALTLCLTALLPAMLGEVSAP
ncbi:MAG: hypothetical protein ACI4PG_06280 [Candidatus Ventricola sp.]